MSYLIFLYTRAVAARLAIKNLFLLFLVVFAGESAKAEGAADFGGRPIDDYSLREWRKKDGLPGNEVTAVLQDREGFIWVATLSGLARFDGTNFEPARFRDPTQAPTSAFSALALNAKGEVLAAPRSGGLLRQENGAFLHYDLGEGVNQLPIETLFVASDGALWIAFENGKVLREHQGTRRFFGKEEGVDPELKTTFANDGAGNFWLANGILLARLENGNLIPLVVPKSKPELRVASSRRDGPWVVSRNRIMKIKGDAIQEVRELSASIGASTVQALVEDSHGNLWFGTRSRGLRLLEGAEINVVFRMPESFNALAEDSHGNVWGGTSGSGLVRVRAGALRCYDRSRGLEETICIGGAEDLQGNIWLANRDNGVATLYKNRVRIPPESRNWTPFVVNTICRRGRGGIWVLGPRGLLKAWMTSGVHWDTVSTEPWLAESKVCFSNRNGELWCGAGQGRLARLNDKTWEYFDANQGYKGGEVLAFAEDKTGTLWVAGAEGQLHRFEKGRFLQVPLPLGKAPGDLRSIFADAQGALWIATSKVGILRLQANGELQVFGTERGIPDNNIAQVACDAMGSLWLSCPSGIYHISIRELENNLLHPEKELHPSMIGADEGISELSSLDNPTPPPWMSDGGILWFATRQGAIAIDTARMGALQPPIKMRINRVRVDATTREAFDNIELSGSHHRVELGVSVLCLSKPSSLRMKYMLEGYDSDWIEAGATTTASYSKLPPGKYRFKVEAILAGTFDTPVSDSITLRVNPLWWQNRWVQVPSLLLCLVSLGFLVRRWSTQHLRRKMEQMARDTALERERTRIARNLHDEIGSGLTRISLLTQSTTNLEPQVQLERIYGTATALSRSMDEIVWAVNPKNDDLDSLATYLGNYAQGFLADGGIRCRLVFPSFPPALELTTASRHQLFLCCKEALNNVAKHAHAGLVIIEIKVVDNQLDISITDNGVGLQQATGNPGERKGNGLSNMASRMADIGGHFEIQNATNGGTLVRLTLKVPPLNTAV